MMKKSRDREGLLFSVDAKWIDPEPAEYLSDEPDRHHPAGILRRRFELQEEVSGQAILRITCHGLYVARLNGHRVGQDVLTPGCFAYPAELCYQEYDVSDLLRQGENEIEVLLGDGWFRSCSGVDGKRNLCGDRLALLAEIDADGQCLLVTDETWEASQNGPIRENDMQQGEVVDGRLQEISGWHGVLVADFPTSGEAFVSPDGLLPIREHERFSGELLTTPDGSLVIDYGQNLAGYIEFSVKAREGQTITLIQGETLDENGNFTTENFQDRKRHAEGGVKQRVTYICREGENHYRTTFSIWGFRYSKVETDIPVENLKAGKFTSIAVYSDMKETAAFRCSNEDLNRLFANCMWSMKSNFCDVPTDCPTRERAGWTGDMAIFAPTALLLMDSTPVIRKWLSACRACQYPDGRVSNIAPLNKKPDFMSGLLAGSTGWGDACILVPWALYEQAGDSSVLAENYDMMKKWYGFLQERAKKRPEGDASDAENPLEDYTIDTPVDYGEWCEPGVDSQAAMRTPQSRVATAYLACSGRLLSRIAGILGDVETEKRLAAYAAKATLAYRALVLKDGHIDADRQAEFVRAISFDLLSEEEKETAAGDLNRLVIESNYHLNTGFLSTPQLCFVLAENGYADTAYRLLLQDTAPSWLYEVKKGATTVWEKWDGIDEKGHPEGSLNHYSYGSIAGFLISGICGIRYRHGEIVLAPCLSDQLDFAEAAFESPAGLIRSAWKKAGDGFEVDMTIPEGEKAELILPDGTKRDIEGGQQVLFWKG